MSALKTGVVINDRYQLESLLGSGGMGVVYRALDLKLRRVCAIKFLRVVISDEKLVRRFHDETRFIARLSSPYIVQVIDEGEYYGRLYIVMEHIEGVTLSALLKRMHNSKHDSKLDSPHERVFTLRRALTLTCDILSGLAEAHLNNIVHRDLKPQNIIITRVHGGGEVPKLLDFGIAKELKAEHSASENHTKGALGTPHYMSPEQFSRSSVDARADLYAVGLILYEMIMGRYPFDLDDPLIPDDIRRLPDEVNIGWLHLHRAVEPPGIDPALDQLLLSMLAKRKEDRPQDALTLIETLRGLISSLSASTLDRVWYQDGLSASVEVSKSSGARSSKARVFWALTLVAVVIAVITLGGPDLWESPSQPPQLVDVEPTSSSGPVTRPKSLIPAATPAASKASETSTASTASTASTSPSTTSVTSPEPPRAHENLKTSDPQQALPPPELPDDESLEPEPSTDGAREGNARQFTKRDFLLLKFQLRRLKDPQLKRALLISTLKRLSPEDYHYRAVKAMINAL